MICPQCQQANPADAAQCRGCGHRFAGAAPAQPEIGDMMTAANNAPAGWRADGSTEDFVVRGPLTVGQLLGGRYEIQQMLGEGGMGAVYKARDRELDRFVAMKVIRADLAQRPEIVKRFRQELVLARDVTHQNVVRIYDLGEDAGVKYITMEYIEGQDLKSLLRARGKFSPDEAIAIMQQVCRGLAAAHARRVIHRDLKPHNIMVDKSGHAAVMDFGLARTEESGSMTQTGVVVGTPEYMSPEQSLGDPLDHRSDIFALGIIFYELLTGKTPYSGATSLSTLIRRKSLRIPPPDKLDASIPQTLSEVVMKCLTIDPDRRFQSAQEILQHLESRKGSRSQTGFSLRDAVRTRQGRAVAAALSTVLTLAVAGYAFRGSLWPAPAALPTSVSLLVADFENRTGDHVFDGTLESAFSLAMEGASFISAHNRGNARKAAAQVHPGATRLDESTARLVAVRDGINVVLAGSIARRGNGYTLQARAVNALDGKLIGSADVEAADKENVLKAVGKLGAQARKILGDTTPESMQAAAAETFSTTSLEAAQSYAQGQELQWAGKWQEALAAYSHAIQLDPQMGRAYSGKAAILSNTGQRAEAERFYQEALSRLNRMTDREKFRTRIGYYLMMRNADKAVEELTALVRQFPADSAGLANLALAHFFRRDMAKALEVGRRAAEQNPRSVISRNNLALYALYAGDAETAAREALRVLEINPAFEKALAALALAQAAQGKFAEAEATCAKLAGVSSWGVSVSAITLADMALYEGRSSNAVETLERGIAADLANRNSGDAAYKYVALAQTHAAHNRWLAAVAAAAKAVENGKDEHVMVSTALVLIGAGQEQKALAHAQQLAARLEPEPQAYAKLIEGEALLKRGKPRDALNPLQDGLKLADSWLLRMALGRAYLAAGAYAEASSEFDTCLKRRGESFAAFLDDVPTLHHLPPLHYYIGRAQEGLKSAGAAESYRTFLTIKQKDDGDPLVADARARVAALKQ